MLKCVCVSRSAATAVAKSPSGPTTAQDDGLAHVRAGHTVACVGMVRGANDVVGLRISLKWVCA